MADIMNELDKIEERISGANFLANKGLSNEVGIHVFRYDPRHELVVRDFIRRLSGEPSDACRIIERDLYSIFMSILAGKRITNAVSGLEKKRGRDYLLTHLQNIAKPQAFLEKMDYGPHERGNGILLLTGVGKAYPFMRSHIILNAM